MGRDEAGDRRGDVLLAEQACGRDAHRAAWAEVVDLQPLLDLFNALEELSALLEVDLAVLGQRESPRAANHELEAESLLERLNVT